MGFVSCTVLGSKRVARFFFILYKTFIQRKRQTTRLV